MGCWVQERMWISKLGKDAKPSSSAVGAVPKEGIGSVYFAKCCLESVVKIATFIGFSGKRGCDQLELAPGSQKQKFPVQALTGQHGRA